MKRRLVVMPYNVLIVDDEKIEREGISFLIKMFKFPLSCREAINGEEALEWFNRESFDIVLCDIMMPYMNGLELCAVIKSINPLVKIVFLTAHAEFSFAKQAIELGVYGYLLKPIVPEEFSVLMNNLLALCKEEEDLRKQAIHLEKVSMEILNYEEERKTFELINGLYSPTSGETVLSAKRMILISCKNSFFDRDKQDWVDKLHQLLPERSYELVLNETQCLIIIEDFKEYQFSDFAVAIQQMFESVFRQMAFITGSISITDYSQYKTEFEKLEQLLAYQFFAENSQILIQSEQSVQDGEIIKTCMDDIRKAFEAEDVSKMKYHLNILFIHLQEKTNYSRFYIKVMLFEILKLVKSKLTDFKEDEQQIAELIENTKQMSGARSLIDSLVDRWEHGLTSSPNYSSRIQLVKKLINKHYMEPISLEWLASKAYWTPSYLSFLFKKETGISLQKFITSFRMEQAEKLIRETSMKIINISQQVGYMNQSYFCSLFRTYYGKTPQKYREDLKS
jgi:two-component system response regulator YesN